MLSLTSYVFFVLILFPYITPFSTSFDTQPWALIFSVLFFIYHQVYVSKGKLSKIFLFSMLMVLFSTLSFLIFSVLGFNDLILALRSLLGYWSLFFIPYATAKLSKNLNGKHLKYIVAVWLLIGLIQYFVDTSFATNILSRVSRSANRGITSLAPEPAWLGRWSVFVIIINDYFRILQKITKKEYNFILVCSICLIILSASGMGIALFGLYIIIRVLSELFLGRNFRSFKNALGLLLIGVIIYMSLSYIPVLGESRAGILLKELKTDINLLTKYSGVTLRLGNPLRAIYGGLIETKGIGFGLGLNIYSDKLLPKWLINILSIHGVERTWGGRVHGGLVSIVYEFGFIGLMYVLHIFTIFLKPIITKSLNIPVSNKVVLITSLFVVFGSLFIEGALSNPMFGFILGLNIFYLSEAYNFKLRS